jgi:Flp pilus assembly CpaE family ATPase
LNRFRKIPGFSESDAEAATGAKLLWKIPNQYFAVSSAIDRGTPLMEQNHTEIARSFAGLAQKLTENDEQVKRAAWSLFKTV